MELVILILLVKVIIESIALLLIEILILWKETVIISFLITIILLGKITCFWREIITYLSSKIVFSKIIVIMENVITNEIIFIRKIAATLNIINGKCIFYLIVT